MKMINLFNKKAQGMSIRTIIIAVLALVVLVVLIAVFANKLGLWGEQAEDVGDTEQFGFGTIGENIEGCDYTTESGDISTNKGTCRKKCILQEKKKSQPITGNKDRKCRVGLSCCD